MLKIALRWVTILFALFTIAISLIPLANRDSTSFENLKSFLAFTDSCNNKPCFWGIIPGETDSETIAHILRNSPYTHNVDIVDIQTKSHHAIWEWSGIQPSVLQDDGYLSYRLETVAYITLKPELILGQIWLTFGEPEIISEDSYYLRLYYFEEGIIIRLRPNCRAIWHSDVWIDIDKRINSPVSKPVSLYKAANNLCSNQQHWP